MTNNHGMYRKRSDAMTRFPAILLTCMALLALTACMQIDTVVKVKPDGSGVVEETFLVKKDLIEQMRRMMEEIAKSMDQAMTEKEIPEETKQAPDAQNKAEKFDIFDEVKLKERVKDMGEGVTYLKGSKIVTDDYEGYRAIYAFGDINKVRINQNPGEKMPSDPQQDSTNARKAKEYITFMFTKGKPAELLIKMPKSKINKSSDDASEDLKPSQNDTEPSEEMKAQIKEMFQGMKMAFAVTVEGNIVETNATYREGSKITLLEFDFGKLIEMPEQLMKLSLSEPNASEEFKALIRDMPGIKVDLNNEIRIKFDQQRN
jgi:hypothetical protein